MHGSPFASQYRESAFDLILLEWPNDDSENFINDRATKRQSFVRGEIIFRNLVRQLLMNIRLAERDTKGD